MWHVLREDFTFSDVKLAMLNLPNLECQCFMLTQLAKWCTDKKFGIAWRGCWKLYYGFNEENSPLSYPHHPKYNILAQKVVAFFFPMNVVWTHTE